jgi:hypothetical protein
MPVDVDAATNVKQWMPQRKLIYANGYWWAFWSDGTYIYYSSSSDGVNWSAKTSLTTVNLDGSYFEVRYFPNYNASYFYFAFSKYDGSTLKIQFAFCRATIGAGTLTWGTEYAVLTWKNRSGGGLQYEMWNPCVGVGTDGLLYAGMDHGLLANHRFRCYTSPTNDGSGVWTETWKATTASYSQTNLFSSSMQQLESGKMLVLYSIGLYLNAYSKYWDGSAWGAEVTFATDTQGTSAGLDFGAVSYGDNVLFVYPASGYVLKLYKYVAGTGWGAQESPSATALDTSTAALTVDTVTGDSWIVFQGNNVLKKLKRAVDGTYSGEAVWQNEADFNNSSFVSAFEVNPSGLVGVTWTIDAVDLQLRFDSLSTSAAVAHYVTCTEIFGASDSKSRSKTVHRTVIELFGALDAKTRAKSIFRTITETFGASDTFSKLKTVITTILHGDAWGRRKRKPQVSNTVLELIRDWLEARRPQN